MLPKVSHISLTHRAHSDRLQHDCFCDRGRLRLPSCDRSSLPPNQAMHQASPKGTDLLTVCESVPEKGSVTPLDTPSWLSWNEETWGLDAQRVTYTQDADGPRLTGVLYKTKQGKVRTPPLNPYLPFKFHPTVTSRLKDTSSQWIPLATELAVDLRRRQVTNSVVLPPGFHDVRPFTWCGFRTQILYTYIGQLPYDLGTAAAAVRKRIRKAERSGYSIARSDDWASIVTCLDETSQAKRFTYKLDARALARASALMGEENFRAYAVRSSTGQVVSAGVVLHAPGGVAVDWVQGSRRTHMQDGIVQMYYAHVLHDLSNARAKTFDFAGANISSVAKAKSAWGLPLVPYIALVPPNAKHAAKTALASARWARWGMQSIPNLGRHVAPSDL